MSEGSVYKRKDGRYVAQYHDATGKVRYIYRKSKQEARQALREALKERDNGIIPASNKTVGVLLDQWLETQKLTVSRRTYINRESTVRVHLKPTLGSKRVAKLTPDDIRRFYRSKLLEGLNPTYIQRMHVTLRQAIPHKYMNGVKPPKASDIVDVDVLGKQDLLKLLATISGDRYEGVFLLAGLMALRLGEALALRGCDIDFCRSVENDM